MQVIIRDLEKNDFSKGFLECLNDLTTVGDITIGDAEKRLELIVANPFHIIHVAEYDNKIIGTAGLLIEPKFIHELGFVGHIEDVVTKKEFQDKKIGGKIIESLLKTAHSKGCYKTILDCSDEVKGFYEKLGFKKVENEMRFDHPKIA